MAFNDWEPDDLLDFHFENPVPKTDAGGSAADSAGNLSNSIEDDFEVFDRLIESNRQQAAAGGLHAGAGRTQPAASKPESGRGLGDDFDFYDQLKSSEISSRRSEAAARSYSAPAPEPQRPVRTDTSRAVRADSSRAVRADASGPAGTEAKRPPKVEPLPEDRFFDKFDRQRSARAKKKPVALPEEKKLHSPVELDAIRQASQDAYNRYRSNYVKNRAKMAGKLELNKAMRILSAAYGVTLVSFLLSMTIMNVLPGGMLIALYVVLGLLSAVIFMQMRRKKIKVWARRLATALAVFLIFIYGMGTVYALGTLSFLGSTSVDNENAVANITKDPFNVVITGIDTTGTIDEKGRSDVNMIVTVNPSTGQILMTSIPRDYQIYMPDHEYGVDKLTHTGTYGVPTTIAAEEDLLDITANYYVKVNFTTVEKFIDAIGGVDVYSENEFTPSYNAYPDDKDAPPEVEGWTVKEGMNHMTGAQALVFARERKSFDDGDRTRIKNQQAVFEAMIKKATSSKTMLLSYNKILSSLKKYFEMSFSSKELRALVKYQLRKNPSWMIFRNQITGGDGSMTTYTTGDEYCYVMTQDEESIGNAKTLIQAVMNGQELGEDDEGNVYVAQTEDSEGAEETTEE